MSFTVPLGLPGAFSPRPSSCSNHLDQDVDQCLEEGWPILYLVLHRCVTHWFLLVNLTSHYLQMDLIAWKCTTKSFTTETFPQCGTAFNISITSSSPYSSRIFILNNSKKNYDSGLHSKGPKYPLHSPEHTVLAKILSCFFQPRPTPRSLYGLVSAKEPLWVQRDQLETRFFNFFHLAESGSACLFSPIKIIQGERHELWTSTGTKY